MGTLLVDIGANLADSVFRDDLDGVLARARAAGVGPIVVTGTSVTESQRALELARQHPGTLWSTAGVHPHHAKTCDESTRAALFELACDPQVVALGECGLDYNRDFSPRPVQRQWLEAQLEWACELGMPVFLHERDAADDLVAMLRTYRPRLARAVVHCFTGSAATLERYLELDLHIGVTGWICDERRGQDLQRAVGQIPLDRLMLETDAPYLLPRTIRPKPTTRRNEPAHLRYVLEAVAEHSGRNIEDVAAATARTAREFFGLPPESIVGA